MSRRPLEGRRRCNLGNELDRLAAIAQTCLNDLQADVEPQSRHLAHIQEDGVSIPAALLAHRDEEAMLMERS